MKQKLISALSEILEIKPVKLALQNFQVIKRAYSMIFHLEIKVSYKFNIYCWATFKDCRATFFLSVVYFWTK